MKTIRRTTYPEHAVLWLAASVYFLALTFAMDAAHAQDLLATQSGQNTPVNMLQSDGLAVYPNGVNNNAVVTGSFGTGMLPSVPGMPCLDANLMAPIGPVDWSGARHEGTNSISTFIAEIQDMQDLEEQGCLPALVY